MKDIKKVTIVTPNLSSQIPDEEHAYMQPLFRTIKGAVRYIREHDPDSTITEYSVRRAVDEGDIPSRTVGNRKIVDVYKVIRYFEA